MESKRTIWIIVVIALILIVGSVIFLYNANSANKERKNQDSDSVKLIDAEGNKATELSNTPNTEFTDLETSDDDFNEIDSTIDYIE